MQTIERKHGSFHDLVFTVDLTGYNKTENDIDDIIFMVKTNISDDDDDALFDKRQSASGIVWTSPNIASVTWEEDEYDTFKKEVDYFAGLMIKFSGDPAFDENVDTLFKIKITEDFVDA